MNHGQKSTAILLSAAIVLGEQTAFGQNNGDSVAEYQWSVTFSYGITSRGPDSDIENAMVASGFNQASPAGWFGESQSHPFSRAGSGLLWGVSLRYAINPPIQLALILSYASNGETTSYRQPLIYLFVHYSVLTIVTAAYVQEGSFRFGIGPALSIVKSWVDDAGKDVNVNSMPKVGVLIDFGLSPPAHSRFFFDPDFQYSFVRKAEIGPYTARFVDSPATMPISRVNFSSYVISIGGGIRF